jgi:predicted regulator of Ras-like GTPase activity (Roadblock/LC7/MglB family)
MRFSVRGQKENGRTGRRPHLRRLAVAAAAVAGVLTATGLPAAASAATRTPYEATASAAGTHAAAASATCAASRPHSGTILYAGITGGQGKLTIHNGLSQDGVVVIVRGHSKAIGVYVRAHASTTVQNVKDGTYTVDFTAGSLFHTCTGRFTSGASYWRFSKSLAFVTTATEYTLWTLTLQPVPNGNAPTTQISPAAFPAP